MGLFSAYDFCFVTQGYFGDADCFRIQFLLHVPITEPIYKVYP